MRTIELTRDEAELMVDLIDKHRKTPTDTVFSDKRLQRLSETIREKFGMVSYETEQLNKAT